MDENNDPCTCEECDGVNGALGCTSANGGCCYYYSTGYLNPKDGTSRNEKWMCTSWHPVTRGITVNAGGEKVKDPETGEFYYNPKRVCMTGSGESGTSVVHLPFICEEGAQSPCDQCELDSLKRISEPKEVYAGWPNTVKLPGECKVCREGYTLHPETKGCCPNDGTWNLGEKDNTCSAVRSSRGVEADGGYCECRGCAAAPAGQGEKGCGSVNGGCCWYSELNGGTCTDIKISEMSKKICNILRGDVQHPQPSSEWECASGVNEPCLECGDRNWNVSIMGKRQCTKCNKGYDLIKELGSCCLKDEWSILHVFVVFVMCIGFGGLVCVGVSMCIKGHSNGSNDDGGYNARGLAGRAGDFGL